MVASASRATDTNQSRVDQPSCTIERHTPVWSIGTGLQTSLQPGTYRITGETHVGDDRYFTLAGRYRIDSRRCSLQTPR